jgi:ribosomal protein L21E
MANRKNIRTRGKLQLSKFFQELKKGDNVAVVKEVSVQASFPENIQGRTGVVEGKQGRDYIVKINDHNRAKKYIIAPIHLKKINNTQ